ncbi:diguanylate cyclase [Paenibacillus sp. NEAU-GSW1]|uniref:histidine kinase N-terminal 7TM domain-containing diguanylate cyclase n=1 Tax=Paenibacillus sp. NEAU-GSW1 TaxID=2682486 RepID=UPI0020A62897|nr:diguanylate cyclase [Paenibacillus sp. NEAU-GSW1]
MIWLDFGVFIVLFGLFFYIFTANSITLLHKIYLGLHSVFMVWPLFQSIAHTTDDPQYKLFYLSCSYVSLSLIGVGWFIFIVVLTGQTPVIRARRLALLSAPGLLSALFAFVNPYGMFLSLKDKSDMSDRFLTAQLENGPFFWFMVTQVLLYLCVSFFIVAYTLRKDVSSRHKKLVRTALNGLYVLIVFGLADLFINIIFIGYFGSYYPIISVGIAIASLYLVHVITKHRVLDIIENVRKDIMNTMSTGIIVLDENDVIIEVNKAMRTVLKLRIGERFTHEAIASQLPKLAAEELESFFAEQRLRPLERLEMEITLHLDKQNYAVVQYAPIFGHKKRVPIGRLLTFHDITQLRLLLEETNSQNELLHIRNRELMVMQDELSQANKKLQSMAITDSLTGCFNRRYLLQQLEQEVAVNIKNGVPFSIFLFDIDLFKQINDKYGHLVGDEVLCGTVDAVRGSLRLTDVLARYGGEEFTVYLPHTNREQADLIADMVKEAVEHNVMNSGNGNQPISVTISMGVVSIDQFDQRVLDDPKAFLRELLSLADAALYEAKYNGRNQVVKRKLA